MLGRIKTGNNNRGALLRSGTVAAALWLAGIASAFGQQYMPIPPGTIIGNLGGQTNAANAVDIPHLIAALSASGMPLDQMTKVGDSIYPMVPSDRVIATSAPLTASRTWTLPLAGSVTAGHPILVIDLAGGVELAGQIRL